MNPRGELRPNLPRQTVNQSPDGVAGSLLFPGNDRRIHSGCCPDHPLPCPSGSEPYLFETSHKCGFHLKLIAEQCRF